MKVLLFLAVLMMPAAAFAQDVSLEVLCKALPDYSQAAGVEYVAGAEDVVPADLNPLKVAAPDVVNIPIDLMLAERFQSVRIPNDLELKPTVALVSIHKNGRVKYDGQDISGQVYSLCGKSVVLKDEVSEEIAPPSDGQQGADVLQSQPELIEIKEGIEGEVLEGQYP